MPSLKAIKKRISSVTNMKKITKAMNLVAASKLQKAKGRLDNVRPMYSDIKDLMERIRAGISDDMDIPFAEEREVKNAAYIVLTSDRGLCGAYNALISKEAFAYVDGQNKKGIDEKIIAVGTKGRDYFRRRGKNIILRCEGPSEATSFTDAEALGHKVAEMYKSGEVDEVYIIYTHFESVLSHIPYIEKLLPLRTASSEDFDPGAHTMSYDPDPITFLEHAVPMYLNITIFGAMTESAVCEYASRMTSMDSATKNASDIVDDLTLEFNRKRQGIITQEITEIVSGANALQ
ncbi:MAG: ATP synthase F1 subunit gamma [Oscillospiraceae bacterium]|nr:ATP synthase F1 subunit gamma [Oscillospiraceae bacterium]MCL2279618.1 ATP synthase F1 subunit gamma [Oscillospiraceae bacterium]